MKVTLKDIADDTGYSVSTVSRVLSGSEKISINTKEEVLECARKLNYLPPKARNSQVSKNVLNIALIASGFHAGEFYVAFYNGLNKAATDDNMHLFLLGIQEPKKQLPDIVKEIALSQFDGAILFVPEFVREDYEQLKEALPGQFPVISNALIEDPVFTTITFDGYSGGYLAARHFDKRDYHNVGIIKGPLERSESRYRVNGYRDYISQHDKMNLTWTFQGDFTYESGARAFQAFDRLDDKPRAIFASNDDMCDGFMETAKGKSYNFPEDIATIGYDDLTVCKHNHPTISSIKTDFKELGTATMKLLREKLANPNMKTGMLSFVPVSVVERESS